MHLKNYFFCLLIMLLINACNDVQNPSPDLFTHLTADKSGIRFNNTITEAETDSTLLLEFAYMGGGVGIGDFNNDGLKDIYFTGNQVSSRLYINKGNNRFEDITEKSGVATAVWATGVSIVDINADGFDDIYVCTFGKDLAHRAKNLLFINQRNLTFKEEAAAYNLADTSYSSQAAFFDYDKDGDLDMYLLNYMLNGPNANTIYPRNLTGSSPANDKLYRNDGNNHFTDVSKEAGIKDDGYGLGVVISDLNADGYQDIYVSDDFLSNDFMWINNRNGTFTNQVSNALRHQAYSSMGVDAADINNDGWPDIATVDMLPENNERKKISFSFMNYERYQMERSMNYEPEFMRNMLQLNMGVNHSKQDQVPFFSEIGQLAGVSETDWSWSVLMADFNNDGYKDMHITNGIGRDFINSDFVQFTTTVTGMQDEAARKKTIKEKLASLEHVKLQNYFYLNNKDLRFQHASDSAGFQHRSMSNGAAWADLDNDGDLDLVVNNINEEAFIYLNNTNQKQHYLQIEFKGDENNRRCFGASVTIYVNEEMQMQEQNPVRGYLSSVDTKMTFGLGNNTMIDQIEVVLPDGASLTYSNIKADTLLIIERPEEVPASDTTKYAGNIFSDISSQLPYVHKETEFNDFAVQRLLPQKFSQLGPFITTGDINSDGLEDFFVGGGFNSPGKFFIQQKNGAFISRNLTDSVKMQEDLDCLLFDADGDKDLDLVVTSGDVRYEENSPWNAPRLYQNDGKGNFAIQPNAFPGAVKTIAGCITTGDYDGDGDSDLFIGGRVAKQYPLSPKSFILQNDKGIFTEVTATVCPALQQGGMITSAIWTDFDNDRRPDLVIAGEWMPVRFFKNNNGKLDEVTRSTGLAATHGMWRSLAAADMDKDGDMDIVAGNLGLNCTYRASEKYPMKLFAKDIDNNGSIDPVMFYYIKTNSGERKLYPSIGKDMLTSQVPALKKKFVHHKEYIPTGVDDIFTDKTDLLEFTCDETATCYFENLGNGKFVKRILPVEAQFAPVNTVLCHDFDGDGHIDLLLAGNEYQTEVMTGRYDASYGLLLQGDGKNTFKPQPPSYSGFITRGDVKNMKLVTTQKLEKLVLVAINNDSSQTFWVSKK
jgi:enediyne biosynthesis protein E4